MKYSALYINTLRELPSDALIESHRLMLRAALIRKLSNGLFAYLPLGLRALRKVETIIREEMEAAGSLEIRAPVLVPASFWKESGRYFTMGEAMLRVKNRVNDELVVSPTAEEAVTALVRAELSSYRQLPLSVFQINTKYRDEIRPRYGVMRAREFTMKDAYSFHRDSACLDRHYHAMEAAYRRIFRRCGLSVIAVGADSGAMGGEGSEEFMVESAVGDNTLFVCESCAKAWNVEKAACNDANDAIGTANGAIGDAALAKIDTPAVKTIAELCSFLNTDASRFIKTLVYRACNAAIDLNGAFPFPTEERGGERVYPELFAAVCIRGDLEVNETKLAALLKASEVSLASDADVERFTGAPLGFAGPCGLSAIPVFADKTACALRQAVCGALEKDKHYINAEYGRDWQPFAIADLRTVVEGDRCPECGGILRARTGNELGHIFKLGDKYTKSMGVSCLEADGKPLTPLMGTYGIGVDRTLASIIEEHHDGAGIVWPLAAAPFHVHVVPVRFDGAVQEAALELERALTALGVETLLDDRDERPGVKFNDADLLGLPFRITIGQKGLAALPPSIEVKRRGQAEARILPLEGAAQALAAQILQELREAALAG